eukprot:gnl/TRDRNA2_/TRDRNA2_174407_c0_seq1.p1 gnl/TRDRNA2_/TRDRNA2_174407_c0~~gnl/TRDRNA2_/TRDRNA2_174407_c0_seq1.p1  ORF type:complete len:365 (+),score=42.03 gnl/TRDRNA2_/TRDRNA2_174407_c0_seq1:128-1096(+)
MQSHVDVAALNAPIYLVPDTCSPSFRPFPPPGLDTLWSVCVADPHHNPNADGLACRVLHLNSFSPSFIGALKRSPLGLSLAERGVELQPDWAHGALVLVENLSPEMMWHAGVVPSKLRPWNVVLLEADLAHLNAVLQSLPCRQRPRMRPSKTTSFSLAPQRAWSGHNVRQLGGTNVSCVDVRSISSTGLGNHRHVPWSGFHKAYACCVETSCPTKALSTPSKPSSRASEDGALPEDSESSECASVAAMSQVGDDLVEDGLAADGDAAEVPAAIDPESAALLQHEQWATFVEARLLGICRKDLPVRRTFVHFSPPSPRTTVTA